MPKKNKEYVIDIINSFIPKYAYTEKQKQIVELLIDEYKFPDGKAIGIFRNTIDLNMFPIEEIAIISDTMFKISKEKELELNNFFYNEEINQYLSYTVPNRQLNRIIEIEDVMQFKNKPRWNGYVSFKKWAEYCESGLITYNPESQRELTSRKIGDRVFEEITIDKRAVKNITEAMLDRTFEPNTMTINILDIEDSIQDFEYDEENHKMIIHVNESTEVNQTDGWHRARAIMNVMKQNPNHEEYMEIRITNFKAKRAKNFIYQEEQKTQMSKSHLKAMNTYDQYVDMTSSLKENKGNNEIADRNLIGTDNQVQNSQCIVTIDVFSTALSEWFGNEKKSAREIGKIRKFIKEFFNVVIDVYSVDFNNIAESQKDNFRTSKNAFYGYIALAEKLYGDSEWEEKLESALEIIDLSINEENKKLGLHVKNPNKTILRKIGNRFRELV